MGWGCSRIRCYKTPRGPAIFRLPEHVSRLFEGAQIIGMQLPFSEEQITSAIKQTVHENALEECYIRPLVYVGYGKLGLNPLGIPIRVAIAAWPWGHIWAKRAWPRGFACGSLRSRATIPTL